MSISDSFSAQSGQTATSRIIVKNLPKRIDERRLSAHFSSLGGSITDVKLMHTPSGVFRRFAFIGFSTPSEAEAAVRHFQNTFIDTSRIEVMTAKSVGDADIPRPWSRHSTGSSLNIEAQKRREAERSAKREAEIAKAKEEVQRKKAYLQSIYGGDQNDQELQKFLSASKTKSQTKTWENDNEDDTTMAVKAKKVKVMPVVNKKPGGQGQLVTKTHVTFASDEEGEGVVEGKDDGNMGNDDSSDDELYEDFLPNRPINDDESSSEDELLSDMDGESRKDEHIQESSNDKSTSNTVSSKSINPDLINETARLFVRNLSYSCTQQDLNALFEPFGQIEEIHLSLSRETKRPRGYAYVKFVSSEDALSAYQRLDGSIFQGRLLHILPAEAKPVTVDSNHTSNGDDDSNDNKKKSYKKEKLAKQKETAGNDFNWNTMFVRSDTVLSAIAEQLGVSKAEIMNPTSDNLAIRLATAETHLIADTKAKLEAEGVDLSVFANKSNNQNRKSKTVIIVKNFPFDTERTELSKTFSKFGPINRFIMPATKTMAMVEFLEANDAKTAFKALAYSKFRNSPLFLEFAPEGILKDTAYANNNTSNNNDNGATGDKPVVIADSITTIGDCNSNNNNNNNRIDQEESNASTTQGDTLYVKNVNFDTTEADLSALFSKMGPIKSLTIPKKRDPRRPDAGLLSMGFAFVQFVNPEHATLALDRLQGTLLDNHALLIKRSQQQPTNQNSVNVKRKSSQNTSSTNHDGTCLMVRNVPFEATERELKALFTNFAAVKRCRLPKKFDGTPRGFAFVDFHNHQDAVQAMQTLSHTHLYGRHLVLEWAKDSTSDTNNDDAVGEARKRAQRNASIINSAGNNAYNQDDIIEDNIDMQ